MLYNQINPHPELKDYIDAYWAVSGNGKELKIEKILPDTCVDIIFNLGDDCVTDNGRYTLQNEKVYLVGTMKGFKENKIKPNANLLGIRFKPGAFSVFYKFGSLYEITDQTIELEKKIAPDLQQTIQYSTTYFDHFLLGKLAKPKHGLFPIIADIQKNKGQINVNILAQRHFITIRQLERYFKQYVGVSPKEFINLVRYQYTLPIIQHKSPFQSLSDIAFECGYYDHAHMANEIKRYTGLPPSRI